MAIGGSPPNAPREKDGTKGAAGRYGFVTEVLRGYLGGLWMARDPSDATERGTVLVRRVTAIPTASARAAILDAARFAQAAGSSTLEIIEARNGVDLVTPFVDAEPLRSLLRTAALRHAPLDAAVLLGIAREIIEQVGRLHDAANRNRSPHGFGGLHPDSILVGTDGRVQLIDAGVAAAASAREPWKSDVQRIGYLAPEQLDLRGVPDARSDVFALGIILWEAFGNRRLFPGADAKSARERVQKSAIVRLDATRTTSVPGTSTPIADLVARALERDPAERFQSATDLSAALAALGPADSDKVGAWVVGLADTVIAKRRQLLARLSLAPPAPRTSIPPSARGAAVRIGGSPLAARTSVPPAARPPPETAALEPSTPPPTPSPAAAAPIDEPTAVAKTEAEATAPATPTEPPPVVPEPERATSATSATAEPSVEAPPLHGPDDEGEAHRQPISDPSPSEPSEAIWDSSPPDPALDSAVTAQAEDAGSDESDAMDVTDDDLGAPPPPSSRSGPPPRTSRPPQLPHKAAADAVTGDTSLLGAPSEPLANPLRTSSELATLTGPAAPDRRGIFLAVGVALVAGMGVGGWCIGRLRAVQHGVAGGGSDVHVLKPSVEAHVESVMAVAAPSASVEPSVTPTPTPSAEASAEASAAPPSTAASAVLPSATASAAPPSTRAAPASTASNPTPRRPPAAQNAAKSGYKPGGI